MRSLVTAILAIITFVPFAVVSSPLKASYVGEIVLTNHPDAVRFTAATADHLGNIYFVDNGSDGVFFIEDPIRLVGKEIDSDLVVKCGVRSFASGSSWQNITFDGEAVYASGRSVTSPPQTLLSKITRTNDGTFTVEDVTGVSSSYSAFEAIRPHQLVAIEYDTGSIQRYTVDGTRAIAVGNPVIGTTNGVYTDISYSPNDLRLYAAYPNRNLSGRVNYYIIGDQAGDLQFPENNPVVAGKESSWDGLEDFTNYYSQVAVSPNGRLLATSYSQGTAGSRSTGVDIYYTGSNFSLPILSINGIEGPERRWPGVAEPLALVFIQHEERLYLGVALKYRQDGLKIFEIQGKAPAGGW